MRRALDRAELVVFLDIPAPRRSRNWLVRRVRYLGRSRPGTPVWFRQPIALQSLWQLLVGWDRRHRPQFMARLADVGRTGEIVHLRSHAAADALVAALLAGGGQAARTDAPRLTPGDEPLEARP